MSDGDESANGLKKSGFVWVVILVLVNIGQSTALFCFIWLKGQGFETVRYDHLSYSTHHTYLYSSYRYFCVTHCLLHHFLKCFYTLIWRKVMKHFWLAHLSYYLYIKKGKQKKGETDKGAVIFCLKSIAIYI